MSTGQSIPLDTATTSSLWDRITEFATRNRKTLIYTTAALTVLVTAGGVYYYTHRGEVGSDAESKRKREKNARKKKQKASVADEESQLNGNLSPKMNND
jgi:mitochondrial import receptor subunit TOM70